MIDIKVLVKPIRFYYIFGKSGGLLSQALDLGKSN